MDTKIICQEILITPDSRFFSKEFDQIKSVEKRNLTQKQMLAEACWNGLLKLSLPEILPELELININEGDRVLDLRFGAYGHHLETEYSINPYLFFNQDRRN
ncbi:MAG: hypothetical protein ABIW47_18700 [Ginsengibacter sp.]|jgi:hypothetical protein